jgi:hypothetical protein
MAADGLSRAATVMGLQLGLQFLEQQEVGGLLIAPDGPIQGWHDRDMTLLDDQAADHQGHRVRHSYPPRKHAYQRRPEQQQGELPRELLRRLLEYFS